MNFSSKVEALEQYLPNFLLFLSFKNDETKNFVEFLANIMKSQPSVKQALKRTERKKDVDIYR